MRTVPPRVRTEAERRHSPCGSYHFRMDPEKVEFLFGTLPPWADPDDPEHRLALLAAEPAGDEERDADDYLGQSDGRVGIRAGVADQIAADDPPQVWQTARRLLADGRDRADVMRQLVLALVPSLVAVVVDGEEFDLDGYLAALHRLPLPSVTECEQAMLDIVRERQPIGMEALDELVAARLGLPTDDPVAEMLLGRVGDGLIHCDGPLELLVDDLVVHVGSLIEPIVLTHRLTADERSSGVLPLGIDLAGFRRCTGLRLPDGDPLADVDGTWVGPSGWLADFPAGEPIAVRVGAAGVVTPTVPGPPAPGPVDELRVSYDAEIAEAGLPIPAEELLLGVLSLHRAAFSQPVAPLSELLAAAGLQTRDTDVAHDQAVWDRAERLAEVGVGFRGEAATHALRLIEGGPAGPDAARQVLDALYDPVVLGTVSGVLFGTSDDRDRVTSTGTLADRLLAAARVPHQHAVAHALAALVGERRGDLADAESHLRDAVRADPAWPCGVDRLAWYCSDRGDAAQALSLWRSIGFEARDDDVRAVEPFAAPPGPKLGRNAPCWCGSGRKFKACHLGRPAPAPLPERVGWLCRKAVGYLERRGGPPREVILAHAVERAVDPEEPDALADALADPLVIDTVLHEGGWFDRFLTERGPVLPADEVLVGRAWTLVERTVYEVLDVSVGRGVTVRDLRTGDRTEVRERAFSREARRGGLICGRAVPDGESHQFVGGLFPVAPGTERRLLDLLDTRDGPALLRHVADRHRPPVIVGPDGTVLDLPDPTDEPAPPAPPMTDAMRQVLALFIEDRERQWCDERIPALGGVTPREAAADPTRRVELDRLIASFPPVDAVAGQVGMRPERLRALLDVPVG